jgi:hypothetical protein
MSGVKSFLEKMDNKGNVLTELFKHMILNDYLFKKNIEVYNISDFKITPEINEKEANVLKTYLSNDIKINGKTIKYCKYNHFKMPNGIILIEDYKKKHKEGLSKVLQSLKDKMISK